MNNGRNLAISACGILTFLSISFIYENKIKDNIIDIQKQRIAQQDSMLRQGLKTKIEYQRKMESMCHDAYYKGMQAVRDSIKSASEKAVKIK